MGKRQIEQLDNVRVGPDKEISEAYEQFLKIFISNSLQKALEICHSELYVTQKLQLAQKYLPVKVNINLSYHDRVDCIYSVKDIERLLNNYLLEKPISIDSADSFNDLVKDFIRAFKRGVDRLKNMDLTNQKILLGDLRSFLGYLKNDFLSTILNKCIETFQNKPTEDYDSFLEYDLDSQFQKIEEQLSDLIQSSNLNERFSKKDIEELSRYLKYENKKFQGLYGEEKPFQCSSGESITAEEFQKQFKSLSENNTKTEALRIKALAYSDLYKKCFKDYARELGFITQDKITNTTTTKSDSNLIASVRNINLEKQLIPALVKQFEQNN